jgi:PAS domain-containing protein
MAQGVLMFDADARLVFCNRRYLAMTERLRHTFGLDERKAIPIRCRPMQFVQ